MYIQFKRKNGHFLGQGKLESCCSTKDFIAKLQIAHKEANETGYWLELLYKTNYIEEATYKNLDSACASIRVMLISSVNTVKSKENNK